MQCNLCNVINHNFMYDFIYDYDDFSTVPWMELARKLRENCGSSKNDGSIQ